MGSKINRRGGTLAVNSSNDVYAEPSSHCWNSQLARISHEGSGVSAIDLLSVFQLFTKMIRVYFEALPEIKFMCLMPLGTRVQVIEITTMCFCYVS